MCIGDLAKRYAAMVLVSIFLVLNSKMCLADHAVASELIIGMATKFETVRDYTCKLDKRVRKNGILYEDLAINVGLEENDFNPGNPEYNFSGVKP